MRATLYLWLAGLMMMGLSGCGPTVGDDAHVRRCDKTCAHLCE